MTGQYHESGTRKRDTIRNRIRANVRHLGTFRSLVPNAVTQRVLAATANDQNAIIFLGEPTSPKGPDA
jgi:hypothetical protein